MGKSTRCRTRRNERLRWREFTPRVLPFGIAEHLRKLAGLRGWPAYRSAHRIGRLVGRRCLLIAGRSRIHRRLKKSRKLAGTLGTCLGRRRGRIGPDGWEHAAEFAGFLSRWWGRRGGCNGLKEASGFFRR